MKYYRSLALASVFAAGLALPALAQTASPDATPAPKADDATPMPDAGIKKAPPTKHVRHTSHHPAKSPKPTTKR